METSSRHGAVPEDGHTLLLMEVEHGQKTFSDCPNLISCLDTVTELYEHSRIAEGLDKGEPKLCDLMNYLKEFTRFEVFVFESEIARYKKVPLEELEKIFVEQLRNLPDNIDDDI